MKMNPFPNVYEGHPKRLLTTLGFLSFLLGKMQILENFVLRTCSLITDARINICVQQEVNILLSKQQFPG